MRGVRIIKETLPVLVIANTKKKQTMWITEKSLPRCPIRFNRRVRAPITVESAILSFLGHLFPGLTLFRNPIITPRFSKKKTPPFGHGGSCDYLVVSHIVVNFSLQLSRVFFLSHKNPMSYDFNEICQYT